MVPEVSGLGTDNSRKGVLAMKTEDGDEKAILRLLWGSRGWEGYRDPTHTGFSLRKLFDFLKAKVEAKHPE